MASNGLLLWRTDCETHTTFNVWCKDLEHGQIWLELVIESIVRSGMRFVMYMSRLTDDWEANSLISNSLSVANLFVEPPQVRQHDQASFLRPLGLRKTRRNRDDAYR